MAADLDNEDLLKTLDLLEWWKGCRMCSDAFSRKELEDELAERKAVTVRDGSLDAVDLSRCALSYAFRRHVVIDKEAPEGKTIVPGGLMIVVRS